MANKRGRKPVIPPKRRVPDDQHFLVGIGDVVIKPVRLCHFPVARINVNSRFVGVLYLVVERTVSGGRLHDKVINVPQFLHLLQASSYYLLLGVVLVKRLAFCRGRFSVILVHERNGRLFPVDEYPGPGETFQSRRYLK